MEANNIVAEYIIVENRENHKLDLKKKCYS
jgi:hypothetical protein